MRAPLFYRIASVLLMLFAVGHTFAFRQNNPEWEADAVIGLMRSVDFDALGFNRSYWDFFSGFGFIFSVFLVFTGVLAWQLSRLPSETLIRMRGIVEPRRLLRRDHYLEFQICLHHSNRFLGPDYRLFNRRRVAFSEAGWKFGFEPLLTEGKSETTDEADDCGEIPIAAH